MADFDATLYFLDEQEIEYLQAEIAARVPAGSAHEHRSRALLDIFEAQADPAVRSEVIEICETRDGLPADRRALPRRRAASAARVAGSLARATRSDARAPRTARAARRTASARRTRCRSCCSRSTTAPSSARARSSRSCSISCARRRWPRCFSGWRRIDNEQLRAAARVGGRSPGGANTAELVRLIHSPDPEVSLEAIRRAGSLKAQAAVLALAQGAQRAATPRAAARRARRSPRSDRRARCRRSSARIEDADRDVRIAAARAYAARAHRPALARLEAVVKGEGIRDADLTEKMAFFEAYGALCGDAGVALSTRCSTEGISRPARGRGDSRVRGDRARPHRNARRRSKRCGRPPAKRTSSCATP